MLAGASGPPTVVVAGFPGDPYPPESYARGFRAVTVSFPRNPDSPLVRLKSLNFLENILGRKEAAAAGADEGIFLNTRGEVTEGTVSNVFLVDSRGRLVTPHPASGLLPGITREVVVELARDLGLEVAEEVVLPEQLRAAREAFLTNSLLGVMPLVALDGAAVGAGRPGEVTRALARAYWTRILGEEPPPGA